MNTRKNIIKLLEDALQKENKKMQHVPTTEIQPKVKTLKQHIKNLNDHLAEFNKQSTSIETNKTLFQVIDALIYIEKDKLDIANEKKNSEKIQLHSDKLDGLASIRNSLPKTDEHNPISPKALKEAINTAASKFPRLTKGAFSINQKLFDEIVPGWNDVQKQKTVTSISITSNNFFSANTTNLIKIVLLGDSQIGKSTIFLRYTNKKYSDKGFEPATLIDFANKNIGNNKIFIWDITGKPAFRKIASAYVPGAFIVILTFDITRRDTFTNLTTWHDIVKKHAPGALIMLAGAKSDLQNKRGVSAKEAAEYAEKIGAKYIEVSAQENKNIDALFNTTLELLQQSNTPAIKC